MLQIESLWRAIGMVLDLCLILCAVQAVYVPVCTSPALGDWTARLSPLTVETFLQRARPWVCVARPVDGRGRSMLQVAAQVISSVPSQRQLCCVEDLGQQRRAARSG